MSHFGFLSIASSPAIMARREREHLIRALPPVKATADPLLSLHKPVNQVREINSKSGSKIMTMRFAPKPTAGMAVGDEARRIVQEAKLAPDGVIAVSAQEIDDTLKDAKKLVR